MGINGKLLPIAEKYGNSANLVYWDILEFDDDLNEDLLDLLIDDLIRKG